MKRLPISQEVTELELGDSPRMDWLAAWAFLAVLAHPDKQRKRDDFIKCCKAYLFKKGIKTGRIARDAIRAEFRQYPERGIWESGPIREAARIVTKRRLPAAAAVMGMLMQEASRHSETLRVQLTYEGIALTSMCEAARAFSRRADRALDTNPSQRRAPDTNWIQSAWSPTKPVLHMAIALHLALADTVTRQRAVNRGLWALSDSPDWARQALERAEFARLRLLPSVRSLRYDPGCAIVLRAKIMHDLTLP